MSYELNGTVKLLQDIQTFDSGFRKREIVVTVQDGDYSQDISIGFLQDKISLLEDIEVGQEVNIAFNITGREYNGRYFNNLNGWKISSNQEEIKDDQAVKDLTAQSGDFDELEDDIPF